MIKQSFKIFLALLVTANAQAADTVSASNYVNVTNTGPAPANFRPFRPDSPWNIHLPENPANIDSVNTPIVKTYAQDSPPTLFMTEDDNAFTGCTGKCAGLNQSTPVYIATNSDPAVTIDCTGVYYGCTNDALYYQTVSSIPGTFHIPAYARGGVNGGFGDDNVSILQPDGTELSLYGCVMNRDWRNGDVIGGINTTNGCSLSGVTVANVVTGYGFTESTGSGDTIMAMYSLYNEIVPAGATIHHALNILLSCPTGSVYPGADLNSPCSVQGLPTGAHIFLNLSHAQIDSLISQGTLSSAMRPFYYALHDYGGYFLDGGTSGCVNELCFAQLWPTMEDASPWIKNGQHNPWIDWFEKQQGVVHWTQDTGTPVVSFQVSLYPPLAPYLEIVSPCYAQGTCNDSVPSGIVSACDVNQSGGSPDVSDVQMAVNQALGTLACVPFAQTGSADINQDGKCTVADVQRVVNAALGGTCVSP